VVTELYDIKKTEATVIVIDEKEYAAFLKDLYSGMIQFFVLTDRKIKSKLKL
jgi:hypothetical protein